jgi:hypothetical protein
VSAAAPNTSGRPPSLLFWAWLRDNATLALVAETGVYHWQPLELTAAPPPRLVLQHTAACPVHLPGQTICSYEIDNPARPTWVLISSRPTGGPAAPTALLHHLGRGGYQHIPALGAALVFATVPAAAAEGTAAAAAATLPSTPPGPTHLLLAVLAATAQREIVVRCAATGTHTVCVH